MTRWHYQGEKGDHAKFIDHTKINTMPLIMGPLFDQENRPGLAYADTESIVLQYRTDREAVRTLLPECYKPAEDPDVRVIFMHSQGVDFMAGNGYRLVIVQVAARYAGNEDQVEGDCVLVVFENATTPIITGREHLGIPKLYADISPVRTLDSGHLRCEASLWGHLLFGIDLAPPLKNQNALVRKEAARLSILRKDFFHTLSAEIRALGLLNIPTLVIWGREDQVIPLRCAEETHRLLSGSRLEILDEAGHLANFDRPEFFNQLVIDFLQEHP